jgi:hypothetical protein
MFIIQGDGNRRKNGGRKIMKSLLNKLNEEHPSWGCEVETSKN